MKSIQGLGTFQMLSIYQRLECLLWRCIAIQGKTTNFNDHTRLVRTMQRCVQILGSGSGGDLTPQWREYVRRSGILINQAVPHFVTAVSALIPHAEIVRCFLEHNIFQGFSENGILMGLVSLFIFCTFITNLIKFGGRYMSRDVLRWNGWSGLNWKTRDGYKEAKFCKQLQNMRFKI